MGVLGEYPILIVLGVPMIAATLGVIVGLARPQPRSDT